MKKPAHCFFYFLLGLAYGYLLAEYSLSPDSEPVSILYILVVVPLISVVFILCHPLKGIGFCSAYLVSMSILIGIKIGLVSLGVIGLGIIFGVIFTRLTYLIEMLKASRKKPVED